MEINSFTSGIFLIFALTSILLLLSIFVWFFKELKVFHSLEGFVHLGKSRVSNLGALIGVASFALLIVLAAHIHWRVYPMEWTEQKTENEGDLKRIREELIAMGFPSELIQVTKSSDLLACKGATRGQLTVLHSTA